jgi:hypothetical protein
MHLESWQGRLYLTLKHGEPNLITDEQITSFSQEMHSIGFKRLIITNEIMLIRIKSSKMSYAD